MKIGQNAGGWERGWGSACAAVLAAAASFCAAVVVPNDAYA